MKLFYSSTSPFVRKVNIFAMECGLADNIEWVKTNPWQAEQPLTSENPLSKIPTLITDDNVVIYDSRVICEYLDTLHNGRKLIPKLLDARWPVLRLQALADGLLDAGILRFMEGKRVQEQQSVDWDSMQKSTIERGLDELEQTMTDWSQVPLNLGIISVGCLLGWLDFRFPSEDWRATRPGLANWYEVYSKRYSMLQTAPKE
jgi:glutathione S-transferase